jgi:hypothetical protein
MSHYIALFRFRLSDGQSIGPSALRKLWSNACGTDDVKVSRVASGPGYGAQSHTYSLCAPAKTINLAHIEVRLRRLLADTALTATLTLTHQN